MADVTLSSAMDTFLTGGILTVTQGTANAGVMASTGYSLTGSNATNMIDLAGTWNTSGTPTAIKLNITNTASNAASILLDLQSSSTSRFKVLATGQIVIGNASLATGTIAVTEDTSGSIRPGYYGTGSGGSISLATYGNGGISNVASTHAPHLISTAIVVGTSSGVANGGNNFGAAGTISFTTSTNAPDISLSRTAASVLKIGGANGGGIKILQATTTLSGVTGASVTATNLVPARAQVIGVATRVTTGLGTGSGTTGYTVGDGSDADRFGAVTGTIAGTDTDSSTDATADPRMTWSTSAQNIVITAAGGNFDGTGVIRVEVYYLGDTAPTA